MKHLNNFKKFLTEDKKSGGILIPRNLEGRKEKAKQNLLRLLHKEVIEGDLEIKFSIESWGKVRHVKGDVTFDEGVLEKGRLPVGNLETVEGDFFCNNNNLTTLEGAPQKVGGYFACDNNNLTTLKGAPQNVDTLTCENNNLTTLEGAPKKVKGGFSCDYNNLTTLAGSPRITGGYFSCKNNKLTTLEGAPKTVGGHFACNNNKLTTLAEAPQTVGGGFYCDDNKVKFTKKDVRLVSDVTGKIIT